MEPNKASTKEPVVDAELEALVSELNRKRTKKLLFIFGMVAGLSAGFYGARWLYQLLFLESL